MHMNEHANESIHPPHAAQAATGQRFSAWAARVSAVLLVGGVATLVSKGVPAGDLSAGSAWTYMGAMLASVLGVVTGIAAFTARMNSH